MHHQCSVDSDIEDWLTLIHLERYWDTFKKHGYGSVKDVLSLSKEDLQKLGITATGHRKRILNLVQQTRLLVRDRSGHMAGDARYSSGKCVHSLDGTKAAEKNEVGTKKDVLVETIPSLGVELDSEDHSQHPRLNKEPAPPVTKPVPKPRTLFPRAHQAAKPEKVLLAQTPAPVCNTTSCSEPPLRTFIILEGFDPGESTTDAERLEFSPKHQAGPGDKVQGVALPPQSRPREGHLEYALQCFAPESGMSVHELTSSATFKSQPEDNASPTVSGPSAGQVQKEPLLLPSALTKSASPGEQKASVSDVTVLLPVKSMEAKETLRSQPSDLVKQNGTVTVENARSLGPLCLDHPPQGLDNRSGPVEESISPYCESMFGQWWPAQEQAAASLEWQEYEELPECAPNQGEERPVNTKIEEKSQSMQPVRIGQNETEGYSSVEALWAKGSPFRLSDHLYPDETSEDLTISPYASYTSLSERSVTVLNGWLDKLSPQGNYVFQRRFVRFDRKSLMYFNNEKEPYPKGLVPLSVIDVVRSTKDNKFQVVTKQRIFVFRAESEAQRNEWCSVLQQRVAEQQLLRPRLCLSGTTRLQKSGHLELKGYKSKLYVVLVLAEMWLYKSEQFFKMGIAICLIEMHGATIREAKGRTFELITPFKIFSFGAESEREKREWMEALQNSIAETLYDYEVAEKIWSNKANRICADCRTLSPDWASVNLCVVICKQCAGQHRSLGSSISKVQSLKLDTSIWSNEMVQLFIMLGNEQVNRFWAAHLPPSEALHPEASADQRREFITRKYRYGRYRMPHPQYSSQENILQALCVAVSGPGLLKKMLQFFATTKETEVGGCGFVSKAKPWDNNGQDQQGNVSVEELSSEGVYNEITQPVAHRGYLYKATVVTKLAATKKSREDFQRVWCSLEKFFLFYETDRSSEPVGKIEMADVISLGVNRTDGLVSPISSERFHFTLELYLISERMQQLGTDGPDSLQSWASALGKWFTPLSCHCLLGYEFQKVGRLCYKSMLNPNQWLQGFFILQKSHLFICPGEEGAAEDSINLRQLQELSVVPLADGPEKKEMLILVEMGR